MGKKTKPPGRPAVRNPVARHAHKTNRCAVFKDRNAYRRAAKHPGREPFPNPRLGAGLEKAA